MRTRVQEWRELSTADYQAKLTSAKLCLSHLPKDPTKSVNDDNNTIFDRAIEELRKIPSQGQGKLSVLTENLERLQQLSAELLPEIKDLSSTVQQRASQQGRS